MPRSVKKNLKKTKLPKGRSVAGKTADILAAPITKSEPAYININEHSAEMASKNRLLWTAVAIFSVILAVFWLFILRANIARETNSIGLNQIGEQITASLARFDTEIKNRETPQEIKSEDLAAIKNGLEEQIKSNPDSSAWPTHELTTLGISLQYPDSWKNTIKGKLATITDQIDSSSVSETDKSGKITITAKSNTKKLSLADWQKTNNTSIAGLTAQRPIFAVSTSSVESMIYQSSSIIANQIEYWAYLNLLNNGTVYEIKVEGRGDNSYYRPLTEEIIRTIRIIK